MVEYIADNVNPFTNPHLVKFIFTDQGVPMADGVQAGLDAAEVSGTTAVVVVLGWEALGDTVAVALGASEPMT